MNIPPERLTLSVKEAAESLGVKPVTIYRLIARRLLKSSNAFRHHRIPKSEIERFLRDTTR